VSILALAADVSKHEQVEVAVDQVIKNVRQTDILLNCHGVWQRCPAAEMTEKDWNRMI